MMHPLFYLYFCVLFRLVGLNFPKNSLFLPSYAFYIHILTIDMTFPY